MMDKNKIEKMGKAKRIIAIIGAACLVLLYVVTLISAIFTSPHTPQLFKACVYATIIVPVMCYGYVLMYRVLKAKAKNMKYDFSPDEGGTATKDGESKTGEK